MIRELVSDHLRHVSGLIVSVEKVGVSHDKQNKEIGIPTVFLLETLVSWELDYPLYVGKRSLLRGRLS